MKSVKVMHSLNYEYSLEKREEQTLALYFSKERDFKMFKKIFKTKFTNLKVHSEVTVQMCSQKFEIFTEKPLQWSLLFVKLQAEWSFRKSNFKEILLTSAPIYFIIWYNLFQQIFSGIIMKKSLNFRF